VKTYLVGCYKGVSNMAAILTGSRKLPEVVRGGLKRPGKTFCLNLNKGTKMSFKCWKSEKHGQFILYSTVTAKPEVRWPLIIKCFVCERTYDKVESDCAMCSLILKFILILRQETKIL